MTFHVGQKVVCVDASDTGKYSPWPTHGSLHGLCAGRVYTVRDWGLYRDQPCLWLEEIARPIKSSQHGETGFSIYRFRPVVERKTDISVFTEMLVPQRELSLTTGERSNG